MDASIAVVESMEVAIMTDMRTVFDALMVFASIIAIGTMVMTGPP